MKDLKSLAHSYNEQFVYNHISTFKPIKVNVQVIGQNYLGINGLGARVFDTIIRVSKLEPTYGSFKEVKWEGSIHIWWQAVADSAKTFQELTNE